MYEIGVNKQYEVGVSVKCGVSDLPVRLPYNPSTPQLAPVWCQDSIFHPLSHDVVKTPQSTAINQS